MNKEIAVFKTDTETINVEVLIEEETVWLTQDQMSILFEKAKSTINEHIKHIYEEGELLEQDSMRKFGFSEFSPSTTKPTNFYNLDVIISVGYRVKSKQGTQFRIWATHVLRDYLLKGYALNQRVDRIENNVEKLSVFSFHFSVR